jgi:hydrogenase maturation factor HypF (carbamoyltransferase family)
MTFGVVCRQAHWGAISCGHCGGFINAAANARIETDINTVALSGGCMHNRGWRDCCARDWKKRGSTCSCTGRSALGMEGLSYGQATVAAAMLGKWKLAGEPH